MTQAVEEWGIQLQGVGQILLVDVVTHLIAWEDGALSPDASYFLAFTRKGSRSLPTGD